MAGRRKARDGSFRLLVVIALTVVLPSLGLALLASRGVEQEKRALAAERESALQSAAWRIRKELVSALDSLREREEDRPYYEYNPLYSDPNALGYGNNFRQSPISETPPDPLVEGYFQLLPEGRLTTPNDAQSLQWLTIRREQNRPQGGQQKEAGQMVRTQRALDKARKIVVPKAGLSQELFDEKEAGKFPGVGGKNRTQRVPQQTVVENIESRDRVAQIAEAQQEQTAQAAPPEPQRDEVKFREVLISPLNFEVDPEEGVVAYRYVDVPNETKAYGGRPILRYVQGFTIDEDYLTGHLFPDLVARHLDVPGARAAIVLEGEQGPPGRLVFEEALAPLPSWRLAVTDDDPGWVSRRVGRIALVLRLGTGLLFLIIGLGLFATFRAVRTEIRLARRKSDFVASVTHELRTPLTGIKMYADMLKAGWVEDEETRRDYYGFMSDETDRLARLVNRVLDFARTEKGQVEAKPLGLSGPIGEVERDYGPRLTEAGFALAIEIEDEREVLADPDAVKQILLNLLENAVKYASAAEDRSVTVRVAPEGPHVVLSVADHGPGVPEEERQRVFGDFYRTGNELTRDTVGAGIGLALVRRLAESIGGEVEVAETPGGGATFRVLLRPA